MLVPVATIRPSALFEAYNICGPGGWKGDLMVGVPDGEAGRILRHSGAMRNIEPEMTAAFCGAAFKNHQRSRPDSFSG
jgi:hypothetical protein